MNNSISLQIQRLKEVIAESYAVLEELGAVMPQERTSYNLVETIMSLFHDESGSYTETFDFITKDGKYLVDNNNNLLNNELMEDADITENIEESNIFLTEDDESTMYLNMDDLSGYINK